LPDNRTNDPPDWVSITPEPPCERWDRRGLLLLFHPVIRMPRLIVSVGGVVGRSAAGGAHRLAHRGGSPGWMPEHAARRTLPMLVVLLRMAVVALLAALCWAVIVATFVVWGSGSVLLSPLGGLGPVSLRCSGGGADDRYGRRPFLWRGGASV
jgi:hypothetical protein